MGLEGRIESSLGRAAATSSHHLQAQSVPNEPHALYTASKRAIDVALAAILLVLSLPVLLLAMAAILLTTRRNPLLAQTRVGLYGREFTMFKLRTMRDGARGPGFRNKTADNPRITGVGVVLRRTSIDELPQLVNVLLGNMSLVGPRPALPAEVAEYRQGWRRRLEVMPGLTGLWQVSGRSALSVERWMALDRCYLHRRSLSFDAAILIRTVAAVITMRGAW